MKRFHFRRTLSLILLFVAMAMGAGYMLRPTPSATDVTPPEINEALLSPDVPPLPVISPPAEESQILTAPEITADPSLWLRDAAVTLRVRIRAPRAASGYEIQAAMNPEFTLIPVSVRTTEAHGDLTFTQPGVYQVRARARDAEGGAASAWSAPVTVTVRRPKRPTPPTACAVGGDKLVGEPVRLTCYFTTVDGRFNVTDESGRTADLAGRGAEFTPLRAGRYFARAIAINRDGVESLPSATLEWVVDDVPPALRERQPANDPLHFLLTPPAFTGIKPITGGDMISFFGGRESLQSSLQFESDRPATEIATLGVRLRKWFEHVGFDFTASGGRSGDTSFVDASALVDRRFDLTGGLRPWQFIAFAGVKARSSDSKQYFSRHYEIAVAGGEFLVPIGSALVVGATGDLGLGAGETRLYEAGVNARYQIDPAWSLGFDYGIRLLDARTVRFAPGGRLPFREGFEQFRFSLIYHF